jgi:hypothetical protein
MQIKILKNSFFPLAANPYRRPHQPHRHHHCFTVATNLPPPQLGMVGHFELAGRPLRVA